MNNPLNDDNTRTLTDYLARTLPTGEEIRAYQRLYERNGQEPLSLFSDLFTAAQTQLDVDFSFHCVSGDPLHASTGFPPVPNMGSDVAGADLGYLMQVGGQTFFLLGDSNRVPGESRIHPGRYHMPAPGMHVVRPDGNGLAGRQVQNTDFPPKWNNGRGTLPGGTLTYKNGNSIAMLTSVVHIIDPIGEHPGRLYRPSLHGDTLHFDGPINATMPTDVSQISGFQDDDGTWHFVTNSIKRDRGITKWRVPPTGDISNTATWEFYNYQEHRWIKYDGRKDGLPTMPGTKDGTGELDYRRLADGSTALMWGGNSSQPGGGFNLLQTPPMNPTGVKDFASRQVGRMFDAVESAAVGLPADQRVAAMDVMDRARRQFEDRAANLAELVDVKPVADVTDQIDAELATLQLFTQRIKIPGMLWEYAPIMINPANSTMTDIDFQFSQWFPGNPEEEGYAERYGIFPARISGLLQFTAKGQPPHCAVPVELR